MAEEYREVVRFSGNDDECTRLIHENYTTIFSSTGSHNKGSSKLTLKNFVNFSWGHFFYRGQLIAMHITEKFVAYGFSKPDSTEGLVRVVKRENNSRALIKGFTNGIEDINFAHLYEIIMLACIDQSGNVYVHVIKDDIASQSLRAFPVFQINGDPSFCYTNRHLISWCQYIPEHVSYLKELEYDPSYKGKILAIVRGSDIEVWHVGMISNYTPGPVYGNFDLNRNVDQNVFNCIQNSVIKLSLNDADIVGLSFSPDGSNISVALNNGSIYFYQITFENSNDPPKCIFPWHPAEVFLSLRSMLFLDNRKYVDGDVELWKYLVTFSTHNELIIWSCESWKLLQRLKFIRPYNTNNPMKLSVDGTGKYLFLSDIDNNLLYVMEVAVDVQCSKSSVRIVSVSEILLQSPMLNMMIVNSRIDHNDVNFIDPHDSSNMNKCSTVINLFAIQPKSIQEGQLIISSPELSVRDQFVESRKLEPTNIFPKAPTLDAIMDSINISQRNSEVRVPDKGNNLIELSTMEVHCLVKEKLKLKGICIKQNNSSLLQIKQNLQSNAYNTMQPISVIQPSNNYIFPKNTYELELEEARRECSPINNEVQQIFTQHALDEELQYNYERIKPQGVHDESYPDSNYSVDLGKDEPLSFSGVDSIFNRSMSTIKQPMDKSDTGFVNQVDDIFACLQDINNQLKWLTKKQKKMDSQISTSLLTNKTVDICRNLEPVLINVVKTTNEHAHKKLQAYIDHQLIASQKKVADIIRNLNPNQINTELFTRSLVASLSPTLDAILKDLFMSTVIPKFEQACVSMFNQIDTSFTERSLEYQNELKLLLNEEGNINNKLEFAFDKFTDNMSNILKITEKKILSAQSEMQEHFSALLKEKSLPHIESIVRGSENIANQFMILAELLDRRNVVGAFEKALSASNLDLVLFVCEKVLPEDLFHHSNVLAIPIVLSLIQQLSQDLIKNTEIKHKYLEAAVSYLDYTNDSHKDKINSVLIKMNINVDKFVQQYPANPCCRRLKMLRLAVKTIINYKNINQRGN